MMKWITLLATTAVVSAESEWKKHTIKENQKNLTVVGGDFSNNGKVDVISFYDNKIVMFKAPEWKEVVLYQEKGLGSGIHSECYDVDGDGDLDYLGAKASGPPFWLENTQDFSNPWVKRVIDPDVSGIHCLLKADVNNDGKMDIIINNFTKKGPLANSVAWWGVPENVKKAEMWERNIFAKGDAPGGSHYFGFGDVDGDGWGEISIAAKGGGKFEFGNWFAVWKNPGKKGVTKAWKKTVIDKDRNGATNILIGDLNGDKTGDFLASQGHGVGVYWYDGKTHEKTIIDNEAKSPHSLVLTDLDNDGDLDGATCAFKSKRVSIYLNDGIGNFTRQDLDTAQESYDLRAIDMDGDGDTDLLNAGRGTKNIAWYENPMK